MGVITLRLGQTILGVGATFTCKAVLLFWAVAGALMCIPVLVVLIGATIRLSPAGILVLAGAVTTWHMSSRRDDDDAHHLLAGLGIERTVS